MKKEKIIKEITHWERELKYYKRKSHPYKMLFELHLKLEILNDIDNE